MLLDHHDAILSDLDGVVYAGPFAIEGAPAALNRAQQLGVSVAFITNNASRSVDAVAQHLQDLGVATDPDHVISSAQAAAELLKDRIAPGSRALICGAPALADCVRKAGFEPVYSQAEEPRAVVQGFNPRIVWEDLAEASYTLADQEVLWVASNTDLTIPKERGIAPGNGTLVAAVAAATGRKPLVAGKPRAPIFKTGAQKLNSVNPLVVGDRLDTDIQGGHRAGMATAAVMTGVETYRSLLSAVPKERPTYILETLADLFTDYPDIRVDTGRGRVRARGAGFEATVEDGIVTITGTGTEANYWRVSCRAWWAANPDTTRQVSPREIRRG